MHRKKYRSFSHWFSYNWGWLIAAGVIALLALYFGDGRIPGEEDGYEAAHWEKMCVAWTCPGLDREPVYLARRVNFAQKGRSI